jgi:large subunit ribosomal protein L24
MSKWIKKDDKVVIIAGNDRGKVGKVLFRRADRVAVQGINIRKKHAKRNTRAGASAEILEMEMPFHISNVSLCNSEGKPIKLKVKQEKDGNKGLFYIENGKEVLHRQLKKISK